MPRIIAYDILRLFIGPNFATPRGIDRVDLAVANQLFADADTPNVGVLPTPFGTRVFDGRYTRRLIDELQDIWKEQQDPAHDVSLQGLIAELCAGQGRPGGALPPAPPHLTRAQGAFRHFGMLWRAGFRIGRSAARAVPRDAVYINIGQLGLAVPSMFEWLHRRPDITCAFMIHDTIPLDHPELVSPASVAHHARMIRTASTHADCLLFGTAFARDSVRDVLEHSHGRDLPALVRPLPVPAAFAEARESLPELAGQHYFVAISTIEPRKNFSLLLRVWHHLLEKLGNGAPHLVIVGAPGREADRILAPLAEDPRMRGHVHPVSGLSSPSLARLVIGSAGVLSPSFAEGFGLPLLEGIAMGVPTIASDIASHREIAGTTTRLLATDDVAGWERAVLETPRSAATVGPLIPREMGEAAFCEDLVEFARAVPAGRRIGA